METGRSFQLLAGLSHTAAFLSWWEEHTWKLQLEKTRYLISQSIQCRRLAVCSVFVMHSALLMTVTVISAYYRRFCPIRRESNGSGTFRKTHTHTHQEYGDLTIWTQLQKSAADLCVQTLHISSLIRIKCEFDSWLAEGHMKWCHFSLLKHTF